MSRINGFLYGFFACFFFGSMALIVRTAMTAPVDRTSFDFRDQRGIQRTLENLILNYQPRVQIFTTTPTLYDIGEEGNYSLYVQTYGVVNQFTRYGDDRYWSPMNKLP